MKSLVLVILMVMNTAQAFETLNLRGKLLNDLNLEGRISKLIVTEQKKEIKLVNDFTEVDNCVDGEYTIKYVGDGNYALEAVGECTEWVDETKADIACPEVYLPVCAELPVKGKMLPSFQTFSNSCDMFRNKAIFVHEGACN